MVPDTIALTENLLLIRGKNRGRFPMCHVFLVQDRVSALIDTGCGLDLLEHVKDSYSIDLVINSHAHPDHISGNWLFPGIPLYVPQVGADSHGRLGPLAQRFFGSGPLSDHWQQWIHEVTGFRDREPTHYFEHGHVFDFGQLQLHALHTPGHTCDHFCLFEPERRLLLSFDVDLTPFGPWYGNLESSLSQFRQSLEEIRALDPLIVASSHADVVSEAVSESLDSFAQVLDRRTDSIKALLSNRPTRADLLRAAPIYRHYPFKPELLQFFEARMIDLHLEELIAQGIVQTDGHTFRMT
jgi:glyoxylase-like metal-dependent hydrolase (beta-lactamase superfamily II)